MDLDIENIAHNLGVSESEGDTTPLTVETPMPGDPSALLQVDFTPVANRPVHGRLAGR
jgi:hypothetical protein